MSRRILEATFLKKAGGKKQPLLSLWITPWRGDSGQPETTTEDFTKARTKLLPCLCDYEVWNLLVTAANVSLTSSAGTWRKQIVCVDAGIIGSEKADIWVVLGGQEIEQKFELDAPKTSSVSHRQWAPPIMCMFQGRQVEKAWKNTKHIGHDPGFCSWSRGLHS